MQTNRENLLVSSKAVSDDTMQLWSRAEKGLNLFVEIEYEAVNEAATCCFESGFFCRCSQFTLYGRYIGICRCNGILFVKDEKMQSYDLFEYNNTTNNC